MNKAYMGMDRKSNDKTYMDMSGFSDTAEKSTTKDQVRSKVPHNFGIEYLDHPSHWNTEITLSDKKTLKVSSIVLATNSPVLKEMIEGVYQKTIDMSDFGEKACRIFVMSLYVGGIQFTKETFGDLSKMAYTFNVSWIKEECFKYFFQLISTAGTVEDEKYLLDEAIAAKVYDKRTRYLETLAGNKAAVLTLKSLQNFEVQLENIENMSTDQLDFLIRVANKSWENIVKGHAKSAKYRHGQPIEYRQMIVEKMTEHIKRFESLDKHTRYTLKHLDFTMRPEGNSNAQPRYKVFGSYPVQEEYADSGADFPGRVTNRCRNFKEVVKKFFAGLMELRDISAEDLKLVLKLSLTSST